MGPILQKAIQQVTQNCMIGPLKWELNIEELAPLRSGK